MNRHDVPRRSIWVACAAGLILASVLWGASVSVAVPAAAPSAPTKASSSAAPASSVLDDAAGLPAPKPARQQEPAPLAPALKQAVDEPAEPPPRAASSLPSVLLALLGIALAGGAVTMALFGRRSLAEVRQNTDS